MLKTTASKVIFRLAILCSLALSGAVVSFAQQQLCEPECETLLSDTAWTMEEKACRKGPRGGGFRKARFQVFMPVKFDQWHGEI